MKKTLLLSAGALAVCCGAVAQETALQPVQYPYVIVTALSPNGRYSASSNSLEGVVSLIDNETGEMTHYYDETNADLYSGGYGTWVSNNGIMVGSPTEGNYASAWFENGECHMLPIQEGDEGVCLAHAITADASRIVGTVGRVQWGLGESDVMQQPVIWNRNAENNGYDMYVELPYPKTDLLGSTPQYVTAVCVSADGKTVAGQVMSSLGMYCYPIVYKEAEDGSWTYWIPNQELFLDPSVEIPADPGDSPQYPELEDYMTAEELEAYKAAQAEYYAYFDDEPQKRDYMTKEEIDAFYDAWDAYMEDPFQPQPVLEDFMSTQGLLAYEAAIDEFYDNAPAYPEITDFMTPEEAAAYEEVAAGYEEALAAWYEAHEKYMDAVYEALANSPTILFNTLSLSGNGRYLAMSDQFVDWFEGTGESTPIVFDLEEGTHYDLTMRADLTATYITDNGTLLACAPIDPYSARATFVCSDLAAGEFVELQSFMKGKNDLTYAWMQEHMVHSFNEQVWDPETGAVVDIPHVNESVTGTCVSTPDLNIVASWQFNVWYGTGFDEEDMKDDDPAYAYSYILPVKGTVGVASASAAAIDLRALKGGVIALRGDVASVAVYDLNGRMVYSAASPAGYVATGLGSGVYVVKAIDAKGNAKIVKAAF